MSDFEEALNLTFRWEGGYSKHKNDPGGETYKGITKNVARKYGYKGSMEKIPMTLIKEIYEYKYWDMVKASRINNNLIAFYLFDTAVNCGIKNAVKILQRAYIAYAFYPLSIDGVMGDKTLKALNGIVDYNSLYAFFKLERIKYYYRIVAKRKKLGVFLKGWINRALNYF